MTTLRSTQPHFIRCIIPNEIKTGGKFPSQTFPLFPILLLLTMQLVCIKHLNTYTKTKGHMEELKLETKSAFLFLSLSSILKTNSSLPNPLL